MLVKKKVIVESRVDHVYNYTKSRRAHNNKQLALHTNPLIDTSISSYPQYTRTLAHASIHTKIQTELPRPNNKSNLNNQNLLFEVFTTLSNRAEVSKVRLKTSNKI